MQNQAALVKRDHDKLTAPSDGFDSPSRHAARELRPIARRDKARSKSRRHDAFSGEVWRQGSNNGLNLR
jgi:hypothetical protein